ncbi:vWA domain-containing protein [Nitriliruptor alkaliphilus]|uniref:vWA domain-containing protein n=1 Tax=Nitriliruptor alkaliphilus TaxID=427918 RepID=UPI000697A3BA|nr:VWA domain-containing protein [Nitriliruptor alkaliphilus]
MPGDDGGLIDVLVGFAGALRDAGLVVGTDDVMTFTAGLAVLEPSDVVDVYWAGRGTLVPRHDQVPTYDRIFRTYFLDAALDDPGDPRHQLRQTLERSATLELPDPEAERSEDGDDQERALGLVASPVEVDRHRSFGSCTPEELAAVRRMISRMRLTPPRRRSRRMVGAKRGRRVDLRRTAREAIGQHGDVDQLRHVRRQLRTRPLVILLDVSGSMSDHSRNLLQFAYSSRRAATKVEVFCFGTRLTRITRHLDRRRPDDAMARAAIAVSDWDGGTRIGDCLDTFVRRWARQGLARGAVVVICSDGLDRGDPEVLATALERLSRLCHRIVWLTPQRGDEPRYRPSTLAMMVAEPYLDEVLGADDLRSLERFAEVLPTLR